MNEIKTLIADNYKLVGKLYTRIAELMTEQKLTENLKETAAILKVYEIILMELNEKTVYQDEANVYQTLHEIKEVFEDEIIRLA